MDYYTPSKLLTELHKDSSAGLYYIRLKSDTAFRSLSAEFYNEFICRSLYPDPSPDPLVIYIGKAAGKQGLYQRLQEELYHRRSGTFFRSLGGVMGKDPKRATALSGINNYRFNCPEKDEIIQFIESNLEVSIVVLPNDLIPNIECSEIKKYKPIFNISHNFSSPIVKKARDRCRMHAGEFLR